MSKLDNFHKVVLERDGYVCQICGREFKHDSYFLPDGRHSILHAHHILTRGAYPQHALDPDVGVCVCNKPPTRCHDGIHNGKYKVPKEHLDRANKLKQL